MLGIRSRLLERALRQSKQEIEGRANAHNQARSLRILHVINSVNPASGGPAEGLRQLCHIYDSGGHENEVATLDAPDDVVQYNFPAKVHALGPGTGVYGYTPLATPWLKEHVSKFDLVFLNCIWQYNVLAAYRALQKCDTPYGVFAHGMLDPYFKIEFPLKHIKKLFYWHFFLHRILHNANAVLFTCEEERLLARRSFNRYQVREHVLNFGIFGPDVDLANAREEFLAGWPRLRGKRLAFSMGRIHPKKGIDILIEAFAQSLARDSNWELVIAGPDQIDHRAELESLAAGLGVAEKITWTGMLGGALKWGALAASDVFVLPSHQENFGIVVAEALACGLPIIISNKVNIWREVDTHNAGLICSDTVESVRGCLKQWSGLKTDEIAEVRIRCRKCFDDYFNYSEIAGKMIELADILSVQKRQR